MKANLGKGNALVAFVLSLGLLSITPTSAAPPATTVASNGGTATFISATGHYYQYVAGPVDFATAKSAAESARANGWAGYLATFSSSQEYSAVKTLFTDSWWIGASDAASEGCWRWVNGSSSDLSSPFFAQQSATACSVPAGAFSGWGVGEPNDFNGNEDHALSGQGGIWNDFNATATDANRPNGYLIEYGDRADFPNPPEVKAPVDQAALTINAIPALIIGATASLSTSGGSGTGSVTFSTSTTSICTVSGTSLTAVAAGTCAISASKAADASYNAATATLNVTISAPVVAKLDPPSISIVMIDLTVGQSYQVNMVGDGVGSAVKTYASLTPSICTLSGLNVTGVAVGTCTISGTRAEDATYKALTATKSVQVTAAPIVDSSPPALSSTSISVTPSAVYENGNFSVSVPVTDATGVASVVATISRSAASTNYSVGDTGLSSGTFNLTKISGTALDGTWSASSSVNFSGGSSNGYLVSGLYDIALTATDTKGQAITVTRNSVLIVGRQSAGPTLVNTSLSVDSLMRGSSFEVSTRAVAYNNTISEVRVMIANLAISTTIPRINFDSYYGDYKGLINIPSTTTPGTYAVTISSNTSNGRTTGAINAGTIQVTAPAPTAVITLPTAGTTVGGSVSITTQASVATGTSGRIAFVCATIDSAKLSSGVSPSGYGNWWAYTGASYGPGSACFQTSSAIGGVGEFKWTIDVSQWTDGSHIFEFFVVDSTGSRSSNISRSFTVQKAAPTASFTTPSDGQTLSGPFTLIASGAVASGSTASIRKVCLTLDDKAVNYGYMSSGAGITTYWGGNGHDGSCWLTNSGLGGSGNFGWSLDATTWANGRHTFTIKIIDSTGKESSVVTRSVIVSIAVPTASFTTPSDGQTLSGPFTLIASGAVASGSTASIRKVCLTLDDKAVNYGYMSSGAGITTYWGGNGHDGSCWLTNSGLGGSGNFGWSLDATTWANGRHTFTIKIIDSTGKESSVVTRSVIVSIAVPTASFTTPSDGQTLSGPFTLIASGAVASGSTASIRKVCLTLDDKAVNYGYMSSGAGITTYWGGNGHDGSCWLTNSGLGGSGNFGWSLDATTWANGRHTFTIKIIDSTGKESSVVTRSVIVSIAVPTASFTTPSDGQTLSGPFTLIASGAVASGSTASIRKVCLTLDDKAVNYGYMSSGAGITTYWGGNGHDGSCWLTNSGLGGSGNFGWSLDAGNFSNGLHRFNVKVIDSTGKESAVASLGITVNNPMPILTIISPNSGAQIAGKVTVEIQISSSIGDLTVGISGGVASPLDYVSSTSSNANGIPADTQLWNAGRRNSFKWILDTTKLPIGQKTFFVTAIDRANQVVSQPLILDIQSIKPTVSIITPSNNQAVKGKVTFRAFFGASAMAQRTIRYIGISDSNAKNLFNGSYGYSRLPGKYQDLAIPSGLTTFDASWTVDYTSKNEGPQEMWFAVEDSEGDITESKVVFTVEKAKPVVQILTPTQGQTFSGQVSLKVNATGDPATSGRIAKIALSNQRFTPQFGGSNTYCNVDSNYKCWSVQDNKTYEWTSEPGAFKDGPISLTVVVFDDSDNQSSTTVNFVISAVAPSITITAPTKTIVSKDQFTLSARAVPNIGSGAEIIGVAISDRRATPQFPGTIATAGTSGIPNTAAIWKVSNIKELSWRIDPSALSEGDNVINIFALDSNGKLGQTSIVIHVAPEATWNLMTQGAAVLGQSVAVVVTMTTASPYKLDPPIVATLQTGPTSGGPWSDTGNLIFDASGKATGRVLVTEKLYVRVNHPQLDAIQVGASEALRIVNVPDPKRQGASTGTGAKNPDGSIPQVVCTASLTAKIKQKVSIVCSAQDVQDVSQPVQITAQTNSSPKNAGKAKIQGGKISGSFTPASAGTYTIFLKGSGIGYVPWTSNPLKIKVK